VRFEIQREMLLREYCLSLSHSFEGGRDGTETVRQQSQFSLAPEIVRRCNLLIQFALFASVSNLTQCRREQIHGLETGEQMRTDDKSLTVRRRLQNRPPTRSTECNNQPHSSRCSSVDIASRMVGFP